jgi:integrase
MKHEKNLKNINGMWTVDVSVMQAGGKLKRLRAAFHTKTEAQAHLDMIRSQKAMRRLGIEVPVARKTAILLEDFAEKVIAQQAEVRPKTLSDQRNSLKAIMRSPLFAGKTLSEVTAEDIARYHAERGADHKPSANGELCLLKLVLRRAVEWGKLDRNPADTVKPYRMALTKLRILTDEEAALLLNAAAPQLVPVLRLLLTTAMRPHEAFNLHWEHDGWETEKKLGTAIVSMKKRAIFIPGLLSKNHKDRWVPLSPELAKMFMGIPRIDGADKVFPYKASPYGFNVAVRAARLKNVSLYTLKHTACSRMIKAGVDIVTVSELVGHSDIKMTARYCHSDGESKRDAVEKASAVYFKDAQVADGPAKSSENDELTRQKVDNAPLSPPYEPLLLS